MTVRFDLDGNVQYWVTSSEEGLVKNLYEDEDIPEIITTINLFKDIVANPYKDIESLSELAELLNAFNETIYLCLIRYEISLNKNEGMVVITLCSD